MLALVDCLHIKHINTLQRSNNDSCAAWVSTPGGGEATGSAGGEGGEERVAREGDGEGESSA